MVHIDTNKGYDDKVLNCVYDGLHESILFMLQEPIFFSQFIGRALLFDNPPRKENAATCVSLMTKAFLASAGTSSRIKVGVNDGTLIGMVTGDKLQLMFSEKNDDAITALQLWQTDEKGQNSGFPYSNGSAIDIHVNVIETVWYSEAQSFNGTQWTNLYYSKKTNLPLFSASTAIYDPDWEEQLLYVVSVDVGLSYMKSFLDTHVRGRVSRIAIQSEKGYVIAATGNIDMTAVMIKSLREIDDPVWKCISNADEFGTNFTKTCIVGDADVTFRVINSVIEKTNDTVWTLYTVLNTESVDESIENGTFVILPCLCVVFLVLLQVFVYLANRFLAERESKITFVKPPEPSIYKSEALGIPFAVEALDCDEIKNFRDPTVSEAIDLIRSGLRECRCSFYKNSTGFLGSISDKRVRDKMASLFGLHPLETKQAGSITSPMLITRPGADFALHPREFVGSEDQETGLGNVLLGVLYCNSLFVEEKLTTFVREMCADCSSEFLFDSFDLFNQLCDVGVKATIANEEMVLGIAIALLCYHSAMKHRKQKGTRILERYFITDSTEITEITNRVLLKLYDIRSDTDESKWKLFVRCLNFYVSHADVRSQFQSTVRSVHFVPTAGVSLTFFDEERSLELTHFVFSVSIMSFLINSPEMIAKAEDILLKGCELSDRDLQTIECMNREYRTRLNAAMSRVFGSHFMAKLRE